MSLSSTGTVTLDCTFAHQFPELSTPWQAETPPDPQLLVLNEPLAVELGLDPAWLRSPAGIGLLTGTVLPEGTAPVAQAYAGHQFGNYVPLLGDGRALLLGELVDTAGNRRDLHLKGSGRTPFARGGDGLAVIGPMLREYILGEAMHALGIPTTRALAVLSTGRLVQRETPQRGAVMARIGASHLRVGSFQLAAQQARRASDLDLLRRLADYAIERHHRDALNAENRYLALFSAVVEAQASLLAKWMLVGFVHGVMNTDNMTISGETIDYGPCAFMEAYDPATVFSSIDHAGRYGYGNQPLVAQWNLARFAETLVPLFAHNEEQALGVAVSTLERFMPRYHAFWAAGMRAKFGLPTDPDHADGSDGLADAALIDQALPMLQESRVDWTSFFRRLSAAGRGDVAPLRDMIVDAQVLDDWFTRWRDLGPDSDAMDRVNPLYIARNQLVEEALTAATDGDLQPVTRLVDAVRSPYDPRDGFDRYTQPAPPDLGGYTTYCGT